MRQQLQNMVIMRKDSKKSKTKLDHAGDAIKAAKTKYDEMLKYTKNTGTGGLI